MEGHRSVQKLWLFYCRFIGLRCHIYALHIYIMCLPDEGPRRTETSNFCNKIAGIDVSRVYFVTICVIIFQHTGRIFIRFYALYVYIYIYIIHQFVNKCRFYESTLLNYAYPCRNWTFQHFARAALKKGRNGINKKLDTR